MTRFGRLETGREDQPDLAGAVVYWVSSKELPNLQFDAPARVSEDWTEIVDSYWYKYRLRAVDLILVDSKYLE